MSKTRSTELQMPRSENVRIFSLKIAALRATVLAQELCEQFPAPAVTLL